MRQTQEANMDMFAMWENQANSKNQDPVPFQHDEDDERPTVVTTIKQGDFKEKPDDFSRLINSNQERLEVSRPSFFDGIMGVAQY